MSQDLFSAIDWQSICASKSFVLVKETGKSDANFVLSYALSQHMGLENEASTGAHVACLVGLSRSLHHYHHVGVRLKVNLHRLEAVKRLRFIDALHDETLVLEGGADVEGLKNLYTQVNEAVQSFFLSKEEVASECLLIVDNVSFLLYIGFSVGSVFAFIEYCRQLMVSVGGRLVALVCSDRDEHLDWRQSQLNSMLAHRAQTLIQVSDLLSGYSRDVNGELTIVRRNGNGGGGGDSNDHIQQHQQQSQRFHFKREDKKVAVFPPGMSATVL